MIIVSFRLALLLFIAVVEASAQKAPSAKPFERFDGVLEPDEWTDGDRFRVRLPDGRLETLSQLPRYKDLTIQTRWRKVFGPTGFYACVFTADGNDLAELLVRNGLARIYGTRTPLPDGKDSRTYFATLRGLEQQAKSAGLGGWRHQSFGSHDPLLNQQPTERKLCRLN